MSNGPLHGLRVLEFKGIGPGPHAAMLLADLGAEVVRIERPGGGGWGNPVVDRGRSSVTVDLRSEEGRAFCLDAADVADVLIEGYRPGVMERLGLGPDVLLARNPRLVYGRMTGWGQTGPLAQAAGHDINYIAVAGALAHIGRAGEAAVPPLNLVGDFGGGSLFLAFGIMAALYERERSGKGQIVDAAIVDGVTSLMTMFEGLAPQRFIDMRRGHNLLGGAAPFYRCYTCADGREVSVGALEPQFYAEFLERVDAPEAIRGPQPGPADWPRHVEILEAHFRTRTAADWCVLLEGSDACFAGVVPLDEVAQHPHMAARQSHVEHDGMLQSVPAPRFSRTPGTLRSSDSEGAARIAAWRAG